MTQAAPRFPHRLLAAAAALCLAATACSDPPPAEPPTGEDLERAWRIAVGQDPLDRTIAEIYSLALNSREAPTIVVEVDHPTHEAALALDDPPSPETPEDEEGEEDERLEIAIARTSLMAQGLDPDGYALLSAPDTGTSIAPAAAPEDLTDLISSQLNSAELLDPTEAVLDAAGVITTVTAEQTGLTEEQPYDLGDIAASCDEFTLGVHLSFAPSDEALADIYDCQPAEVLVDTEETLVQMLISAQIDVALISSSHPLVEENALVSLTDTEGAFPQDQYAPVVSARISQDIPEIVEEISAALDTEAMQTLRKLIVSPEPLTPAEAAEYWLVSEDIIAAPEDWG